MTINFIKTISTLCLVLVFQTLAFGQFPQMGQDILGTQTNEYLGSTTAINIDGSVIAVASPGYDGVNGVNSGRVVIYNWNGTTWIQKGSAIDGEAASDGSGSSVSISADGNIVAIGADYNDGNGNGAGHVRIYEWNGTTWVQRGTDIDGETALDYSGRSVSMSADGNIVAIGAPNNDGNGTDAGHVRIYQWNGTTWIQKGSNIDGEAFYDQSGSSVSMSADGNLVAIGAVINAGFGPIPRVGHVRIYQWNGTTWIQKGSDIDGEAIGDESGNSVSMSADGNIVAIGGPHNDENGNNAGHVRIYQWNGITWIQKGSDIDGEAAGDESGNSVSMSANGNLVAIGANNNDGNGNYAGHVRIYQWNGTTWIQKGSDIDGEAAFNQSGSSVSMSANGNIIVIGAPHHGNGFGPTYHANGVDTGKVRIFAIPNIGGSTYLDVNQNCQQGTLETAGIVDRNLIINPGNILVQTAANGSWGIDSLPIGNYTITTDTNSANNYQPCAATYSFSVTNPDSSIQVPPIGYQSTRQCTAPNISIHAPFLRPGFSNQYVYIQACNTYDATAILDSAYVVVELDSLLTVDTASLNYTSLGNNQYYFYVDSLYPNQCVNFWISTTLNLNATLGQSLCMNAKLYPIDSCALDSVPNTVIGIPCSTPFDGSHLAIWSDCSSNDSITFTITNTEGNMNCWSQVRLYINGSLVRLDSVQLASGQSQTFTYAGDGRTWRMEVDQHPLHWGNSQPSSTIELCGNANNWTSNLVNVLPMDDADPVVDIYCGLVTGSYDPNDKTGFPLGKGVDKEILPNQKLEYLIRFQNTGTDTAFTVVIRDTLSTDFDIFSVKSGVSSNDYTFRMYGPRVLEWTFNNIMLPDSNVNEPESHGFVKFEVKQNKDLPNGTLLENSAAIFFDFNAPIITNTSVHTVDDGVNSIITNQQQLAIQDALQIKLYPNPTTGMLQLDKQDNKLVQWQVTDQLGRVLQASQTSQQLSTIDLTNLSAGLYFITINNGREAVTQKIVKQ